MLEERADYLKLRSSNRFEKTLRVVKRPATEKNASEELCERRVRQVFWPKEAEGR
jgi:hypothetical protein